MSEKRTKIIYSGIPSTNFRSHAATAAKSLQSCPTLCDPADGSPPGSPIPGILQAKPDHIISVNSAHRKGFSLGILNDEAAAATTTAKKRVQLPV